MTDYYAEQGHGGSNAGTVDNPWTDLASVDDTQLSAGDTLHCTGTFVDNLDYGSAGGSAGNPVTIDALVVDGTATSVANQLDFNTADYIALTNLTMTNPCGAYVGATNYAIRFLNGGGTGFEYSDSIVTGPGSGTDLENVTTHTITNGDVTDVIIENVQSIGNVGRAAAFQHNAGTGIASDVTVRHCTATGGKAAFYYQQADSETDFGAGRFGANVRFDDCIAIDPLETAFSTRLLTGGRITRAYVKNCGVGTAFANGINPGADIDMVVSDCVVDGVTGTGTGDGHGIIIDWAGGGSTEALRCNVLRNWVKDAAKANNASGVQNWKGINSVIDSNVAIDCATGFSSANSESTGAVFNGNTAMGCTFAGFQSFTGTAAAATVKNSILDCASTTYVVKVAATGTIPVLSYNCYFGYTEAQPIDNNGTPVAEDANSIILDPLFMSSTDARLDGDSPCIAIGEAQGMGENIIGQDGLRFYHKRSMGGYEVRTTSGYARKGTALVANTLPAGVDIAKAKAA